MRRLQNVVLFGFVIAIPVAAHAFLSSSNLSPARQQPCFVAGAAAYRISNAGHADYRVRVARDAAHPDLRIRLVDQPETADFVLADDLDDANDTSCAATAPLTIRVDAGDPVPDLTISLSDDAAAADAYRLYVRSARFSQQEAAALFGVMERASRQRSVAQRR